MEANSKGGLLGCLASSLVLINLLVLMGQNGATCEVAVNLEEQEGVWWPLLEPNTDTNTRSWKTRRAASGAHDAPQSSKATRHFQHHHQGKFCFVFVLNHQASGQQRHLITRSNQVGEPDLRRRELID